MARKTHPSDNSKPASSSKIVAEETTTLPEGAVLSVYRISVGKLGHYTTRLVAMHANFARIEMGMDNVGPHNLRTYLELVKRDIERRRALLTQKPAMDHPKPNDMEQFVTSMAFNGMFILQPWNAQPQPTTNIDVDNPKPTKKVVSRRRKVSKPAPILPNNNGTVQGSRKTAADS